MSANLKSEIAAAQKARARYGKFFTKEKFSQMASCSSLQEVAASIRENPFFAEGFGNISDAAVNRETLERILKERLFTDLSQLFGFDFSDIEKKLGIDCFSCITDYSAIEKPELMYNKNVSEKIRALSSSL